MKKRKYIALMLAAVMGASVAAGCGQGSSTQPAESAAGTKETAAVTTTDEASEAESAESSGEFVPKLDTDSDVELQISGFFGNFEALDQVENEFNEYYPNITFSYEQNGDSQLAEYLQNNSYVDIFMTSDDSIRYPELTEKYVGDSCVDFAAEDIDLSGIQEEMLTGVTVDKKVLRIPMAEKVYGMVVNQTLLKNEGLEEPTDYASFLEVLEALKEKGYTPIQGATTHVYSDLIDSMAMTIAGTDAALAEQLNSKDGSCAESFRPVYEKLQELIEKGYTDYDINSTYPDNNYDEAILTFFEGNVPFWICDSENYSGMKKRESKSEHFSAEPFDYQFQYVPLGENGVYQYAEPWYGFSVNKNSDKLDYAVEFIRFLATRDSMELIASVKNVPSAAKDSQDERFVAIRNPEKVEATYLYDGKVNSYVRRFFEATAKSLGCSELSDVDAAIADLQEKIEQ